jgi:serine/threonine-protein kinase
MPLGLGWRSIVLSPDGGRLVFVTVGEDDVRRLAVRDLDDYSIRTLPGTEGAFDPFFSPAGDWLAFFTGDRLRKVSMRGGEPVTVCEARTPRGGTWWGGSIVFSDDEGARLARVSADGGQPQTLVTSTTLGSAAVMWPSFLPGGENLLATLERMDSFNPDQSLIVALSADGGGRRDLLSGGSYARFAPPGHLVYARAGSLLAVPFDLGQLGVHGDPRTVLQGVRTEARGVPQATIAQDGTLAYLPGSPMGLGELVWADRDGRVESLGLERERFGAFDLSVDGRRLVIVISDERDHIWLYELDRGTRVKLTVEGSNSFPVLSPDGQRMAFRSSRAGSADVYLMPLDGTADPRRLTDGPGRKAPYSWTHDGRSLAIVTYGGSTPSSLALVGDKSGELRPLAGSGAIEWGPAVSPDGTYVAFTSDVSGRYEVHVRELAGEGRTWKVSAEGGEEPQWSTDGSALFYRNGTVWMEVPVTTKPTFSPGRPREALRGPYLNVIGLSYRVSADGQRFLVIRTAETDGLARTVNVISNWTSELP